MKEFFAPSLNRHIKLGGRRMPLPHVPRMRLRNYFGAVVPDPPVNIDYGNAAALPALKQMYLNDIEGDCVIAGRYHILGVATANATGSPFIATPSQINADYHAIGGFVPGRPETDQGCDEHTALVYWSQHGLADGSKDLGWFALDATNQKLMQQGLWLFENHFFGLALPDAWVNPFPDHDGVVWDVAGDPNPDNGHCVIAYKADKDGVWIDTWGLKVLLTWRAVAKYAVPAAGGEVYTILSPRMVANAQAKAPSGLLWADVIRDFNTLSGQNLPVPATAPSPAPNPSPAPAPTIKSLNLIQTQALLAQYWPK